MKTRTMVALLALTIISSAALVLVQDDAQADAPSYDLDYGDFWGYRLQFVFSGETGGGTATILWDFGDGSSSAEWNPLHTYGSTGVYYVTQTVSNDFNGSSSSTAIYRVNICGYPTVTFVNGDVSTPVEGRFNQTLAATGATIPVLEKEGFTFAGWYSDDALTQPFSISETLIMGPTTVYAAWAPVGESDGNDEEKNLIDKVKDMINNPGEKEIVEIAAIAIAIVGALGFAVFRRPELLVIVAVAIVAVVMISQGVISW